MKSQLKTPKQVKVTAVVTMLKVFGDKNNNSRNDNPKKYFINKRVLDIIIHTMENSNITSPVITSPVAGGSVKRKCTWRWPPCDKWMQNNKNKLLRYARTKTQRDKI